MVPSAAQTLPESILLNGTWLCSMRWAAFMQGLREWPAFIDCKKTIDTFLAGLPLLQSLAHKSMRPRHWSEVMRVTGTQLNTAEDVMKLQHLLDAQLVDHSEEVGAVAHAGIACRATHAEMHQLLCAIVLQ